MFVLNAVKEPEIFGGGCALIKAFGTGSQWVNASQIAFNIVIPPTHTPNLVPRVSLSCPQSALGDRRERARPWEQARGWHSP